MKPTDTPHSPTPVTGYVVKMYPRFSETFIVSEILAREAAGERIVIFSLRPPTDARFHAELASVKAEVIQIPRTSNPTKGWVRFGEVASDERFSSGLIEAMPQLLASDFDDAWQAAQLAQAARDNGVTHLHAHFASVATTVAQLAAKISGLPYSFTAHAKDIFHEDIDHQLLQRKLAEAHHAVTISEYNVTSLRQRFGSATERLHLVRNGLDLSQFSYQPRVQSPDSIPRILAVGRLVEKKGFGLLIEAVAALRQRGVTVQVDIAGDGPLRTDLENQIAEHQVQDVVHLLGPRTLAEVHELLGSHDVFAAPFVIGSDGNADGLPTVLLEAMARGIRCVAADVTAVSEVISGEPAADTTTKRGPTLWRRETGWLVPSGDVVALTDALHEAVQPGDYAAMTDAARRLVQQQFCSRRQAAQLQALVHNPQAHTPAVSAPEMSAGTVNNQAFDDPSYQPGGQADHLRAAQSLNPEHPGGPIPAEDLAAATEAEGVMP